MSAIMGSGGFITQPPQSNTYGDELPASSQSTLLLQKKKEMVEVQQQLERKKEEFRMRMQRCQEKEVELASKQEAIKEQVRKFDKFLKDNDAKRVRANRKAMDEVKLRMVKEQEIQQLQEELERQKAKRDELQEELERKLIYKEFLERTCDSSDYFEEDIENILKRYETLAATHLELSRRVQHTEKETEEQTKELKGHIKESQTESLVLNSKIANRQKALDHMRVKAQDDNSELYRRDTAAKEGIRGLGEISMAIQNIYSRCLQSKGRAQRHSSYDENCHSLYLDAVQQRLLDLSWIAGSTKQLGNSDGMSKPKEAAAGGGASPTAPPRSSGGGARATGAESRGGRTALQ